MLTWLIIILAYLVMTISVYFYDTYVGFDFDLDGSNNPPLWLASIFWWITISVVICIFFTRRIRFLLRSSKKLNFTYFSKIREQNREKLANGKYYESNRVAYYKDGDFHRLDGPALEYYSGDWSWYKEGKLHREGGPARLIEGDIAWYKEGELHRLDGPAYICSNGKMSWYLNGKKIDCNNQEHFLKIVNLRAFW